MVHVNNTHLHEQKKTKNPLYTDDNDDNEEAFARLAVSQVITAKLLFIVV